MLVYLASNIGILSFSRELFSVAEQRRQADSDVIGQSDSDVIVGTQRMCDVTGDASDSGTDFAATDRSQAEGGDGKEEREARNKQEEAYYVDQKEEQ